MLSPSDQVDGREHDDPHRVHEVPVPGEKLSSFRLPGCDVSTEGEGQNECDQEEADRHVRGLQTNERVVGRSEQTGADRHPASDESFPFLGRTEENAEPESQRRQPPGTERLQASPPQRPYRQRDGDAAREQRDGSADGGLEHVVRRGAAEALPDVEEISGDEDREEGALGDDQAEHRHAAAARDRPGSGRCVHSYRQSGSSGCFASQSGRRLRTTGTVAKLYSGGGELVLHSSVQASQGSSPATAPERSERMTFSTSARMPAAWKSTPIDATRL